MMDQRRITEAPHPGLTILAIQLGLDFRFRAKLRKNTDGCGQEPARQYGLESHPKVTITEEQTTALS